MADASKPPLPPSVASSTSYTTTAAAYALSRFHRALLAVTSVTQFPSITLTAEEQAHYDRVVGRLLYCAVQEYSQFNGVVDRKMWAPVRKNRHMAIYRDQRGTGNPRVTRMLGVGKIDGSLEDVMDGVYSATPEEIRTVMTFLKSQITNASILQVSETRTPDDPFTFAGIKWWAAKTPGGRMSYDRDLLNYERQGMTFDADGNEIAYHLLQSVDRPEWPANTFRSLIRAHMSTCYLYKRKGKQVETFFWGEFYGSGNFPQSVSDFGIAGRWLTVVNTVKCARAKKLSQLRERANARFNASNATAADKYNVCRSCSKVKEIFKLDKSARPIRDRFCNRCLVLVAAQRGSRITWDGIAAEQPPAYFDYVFQLSRRDFQLAAITSEANTIDTAYIDESMKRLGLVYGDVDRSEWSDYYRRRMSHADRLSRSSYSSADDVLSDLYRD
uniref:START domain-containing protein n=1 Tax=Globisporangium ultimum (strain ATCC 200006 / CBS 805.95 / DAOM BR144) TaxID=431595 RepID=K3X119_GLOUD